MRINYKNQEVLDGYYGEIEPLLNKNKEVKQFVKIINNGLSKKIGDSQIFEKIYEK